MQDETDETGRNGGLVYQSRHEPASNSFKGRFRHISTPTGSQATEHDALVSTKKAQRTQRGKQGRSYKPDSGWQVRQQGRGGLALVSLHD